MVATESVGGIIAGRNPLEYTPSNPITLFLFQAIFIIALCQLVHIPLGFIRQPRVIAEVISGILLGPTVMGRIPNFTATCFPTQSRYMLSLVANIGIIYFLFLVGLEVDLKFIKKNLNIALTVGMINMVIPFGFGCLIAIGLHEQYGSELKFTTFMVFIAVAMCITAFPVLARILTELRLLKERVGTVVLAAGITNDVIGWVLLALSVTLANAGSGINTLYILLVTVGWALFVIFPLRWLLHKVVLRKDLRTGTLSRTGILIILLLVFISSFFTDIIGVHPIFGAFLIGLIVPREHGFVIEISHKIEDLVHIMFIPIYFALAGFNVNFGELSQGIDWGYIVALIVIAVVTKIAGGFIGAKICGFYWRESLTVGVLMSCKGIVEIVVLNVGLSAGIISSKVYSMFILMTLVSTFLTTPLTLWAYPISYREKVQRYTKGEISWDGTEIEKTMTDATASSFLCDKLIYNVDDTQGILSLLSFTELFYGEKSHNPTLNVILMKELTERTADLIGASMDDLKYDPILEILRKMFEYNQIPYVGDLVYYVEQHKLVTFLEVSDNAQDLMIYGLQGDQLDDKILQDLDREIIQKFGLFLKNSSNKISELTVILDADHDLNQLMLFVLKNMIPNGIIAINIITTDLEDQQVLGFIESIELGEGSKSIEVHKNQEWDGLVIGKLDRDTLLDMSAQLNEKELDGLLVI
jgi:Kef-type K+ transport system membrane component KefB